MPTKLEIAALNREARDLKKLLRSSERSSLAESSAQRKIIKEAERKLNRIESEYSDLAKRIDRRLAFLEGRSEA